MSEESIEKITKSDSNFAPTFTYHHFLVDMNFNEHCLIKKKNSVPRKVINLYISYTLGPQLRNLDSDFTLSNCLFGYNNSWIVWINRNSLDCFVC